ncbi:MAG TPA: TetR/AcrR family transcriptional regulator [Streptosporangiaceae bacterium]|nr:TetR/AcrR family transcriptional regulator [Streptosporangiaceae bacterium]
MASGSRPYHHGNLRPALISAAIGEIEESGPAAMSLRAVARRAGVTHAAATYHFGDRAGLLTAVAAEGYRLLAEALREAQETRGSFLEVGVAYVRFAVTHRAHFEVMYRPELYHRDDAELGRAREAAATLLYGTGEITPERMAYGVAAWSIVHGLATLWLNGNLPAQLGDDPEEITRVVAAHLDPPRRDPALAGRQPGKAAGGRVADSTHGEESSCRTSGPARKTPAGTGPAARTTAAEGADGHDRHHTDARHPLTACKPDAVFADRRSRAARDPAGRGQLLILASGPAAAAGTAGPVSGITGRKTVGWARPAEAARSSWPSTLVCPSLSRARPRRWHRQAGWASATRNWPRSSRAGRWTRRSPMPTSTRRTARLCAGVPLERTLKDANLALRAAGGTDLPPPAVLSRRWHAAADTGHSRQGISAARLALRRPGTD